MHKTQIGKGLIVASVVGLFGAGCEPLSPPGTAVKQPQGSASAPKSEPGIIEAKDATGVWNQAQVEQYLRDELKLSSLSLQSTGSNGYQGTGQGKDGQEYTSLVVKQVPGGIKTTWSTPTGKGSMSFGNPVP